MTFASDQSPTAKSAGRTYATGSNSKLLSFAHAMWVLAMKALSTVVCTRFAYIAAVTSSCSR